MSDHDPLCPENDPPDEAYMNLCICDRLRAARADERERIARAIETWGGGRPRTASWQDTAARIARGRT